MSGRDLEPVAAFFPSIDRNLMRDLDRHLRGTQDGAPEPASLAEPARMSEPERAHQSPRPDIAGVVEAVEQAAASIAAMSERIQMLETQVDHVEGVNQDLTAQLSDAVQNREAIEAALRSERERGQRVEALAAHHVSRATALERDLDLARSDLGRVVAAINQALGQV